MNDKLKIWKEIIKVTEAASSESLKALKTILFLRFTNNSKARLKNHLSFIIKIFYQLTWYKKVNLNSFIKGKYLFYLPFDTPANSNNLLPVMFDIQPDEMGLLLISNTVNPSALESFGYPILIYGDLIASIPFQKRLLCFYKSFKESSGLISSIKINPVLKGNLNIYFNIFMLYYVFSTFLSEIACRKLLETVNPMAVISTTEYFPFDYLLIQNAQRYQISNFIIQHGIIGINYFPFVTDNMIVWGDHFRKDLLNYGADDKKIHVLGMPASDKIFRRSGDHTKRRITGINKVLILSDTQARYIWPAEYDSFYNLISEIVPSNRQTRFLVRLHPAESASYYKDLLVNNPNLTLLDRSNTLYDDIDSCDIALTIWSTAGLETMICGIPLIVLQVSPSVGELAWWPSLGGGRFISNGKEFNELIDSFKESPELIEEQIKRQDQFIKGCFVNQGEASLKIAEFIEGQTKATINND